MNERNKLKKCISPMDQHMERNNINFMEKFIDYRGQLSSYRKSLKYYDGEFPYMSTTSVPVLLSFAGFLKSQLQESKSRNCAVFVRGHSKNHDHLTPSLFRDTNLNETNYRNYFNAYQKLVIEIKSKFKQDRFQNEIGPILQHYGFKSPWLDVVDNIYNALWFAQHEYNHNDGKPFYLKNNCDGWLTFIATKNKYGDELEIRDLRSMHSSLSLRMAAQHGYSLISTIILTEFNVFNDIKLDSFIIAKVKIPKNEEFNMENKFMSVENMFPRESFDNTAKVFSHNDISPLCIKIENEFNIPTGSLGRYERPTEELCVKKKLNLNE